jgi:hypothetical protein
MKPRTPSPRPTKWPGAWSSTALAQSIAPDQLPLFELTSDERQATARYRRRRERMRDELRTRLSVPRLLRPMQSEPTWRVDRHD